MTDNEILKAMSDLLNPVIVDLSEIKSKIVVVEKVSSLDEKVGSLDGKVDSLDEKVDRNYGKILEFYAYQRETNESLTEKVAYTEEKLNIFSDQTIKNMVELKRYK